MRFVKYQAIGNDYLVIRPTDIDVSFDRTQIQRICHRNYGIRSDGILLGPLDSSACDFRLRIFNPDGSEAEKSGNGLRVFSRFLWDEGLVHETAFAIETLGGPVTCRVEEGGKNVTVQMGEVSFASSKIPVAGSQREVVRVCQGVIDAELFEK